jgi:hypothetical protein
MAGIQGHQRRHPDAGRRRQSMSMPVVERIMKKLIVAACAAILLGAPMALAAGTSSKVSNAKEGGHHVDDATLASQCTMLSQQFDRAEAAHKTDKNYTQALALDTEGSTLCSSNKQAAGVAYLQSAVKMIGLKANI